MIMKTKEKLIELLSEEDAEVLSQAYLYAKKLTVYGVDVTEKWVTATQNARALGKAYREGYYEALAQEDVLNKIRAEIEASKWTNKDLRIERNALASGLDKALEIIDKYRESEG